MKQRDATVEAEIIALLNDRMKPDHGTKVYTARYLNGLGATDRAAAMTDIVRQAYVQPHDLEAWRYLT